MSLNFNLPTAIVTAIAVPLLYYFLKRVRKFLQENLSFALDGLFWLLGRFFVHSLAIRFSLKRYCRLKLNDSSNRYLQVPGRSPTALETDQIFVPLDLEPRQGESPESMESPFEGGGRVRIIGDPGSGKSSFVKQMFREACRFGEGANRRTEGSRLPIMVELKQLKPPTSFESEDAAGQWAVDELRKRVEDVRGFEMGKLFDSFLSGAGLIVLLDGLDEVASDDYPSIELAIRGLSKHLANQSNHNLAVLTMRVQFHQQIHSDFDEEFPVVLKISPFKPTDIFQFLERWPFPSDRFQEVSRIYSELTDRPTLREMCSNPLVLAMYVANDQDATVQRVVDTRTSFYNQVVDELLVMRRSRQLAKAARSTLRDQREAILGRLALDNLLDESQPANSLSWSKAVDLIREVSGCKTWAEAEAQLHDLARDTGIVSQERENESLRFIHLTFCEFLAAKEAAVGRKNGWEHLLRCHSAFRSSGQAQLRSRLNEVIPFAAALLPRSQRSDAVDEVAANSGADVLGRCFLETQTYSGDTWETYVETERSELTETNPEDWTDEWLARLHLFNVVLHDAEEWSELSGGGFDLKLRELFADLVGTDRDRLVRVFGSYAINDPAAALRLAEDCGVDLAEEYPDLIIQNCDFPPFLAVAMQRAISEASTNPRWLTLLAEAGLRGSSLAAFVMNSREAPKDLENQVLRVPRSQRWISLRQELWLFGGSAKRRASKQSCYSAFITLALAQPGEVAAEFPALRIVRQVPAPGSARSAAFVRLVWGVVLLAGLAWPIASGHTWNSLTRLGYLSFLMLATWPIYAYPRNRSNYYSAVANVSWLMSDRVTYSYRYGSLANRSMSPAVFILMVRRVFGRIYLRRLNQALKELGAIRFGDQGKGKPVAAVALRAAEEKVPAEAS